MSDSVINDLDIQALVDGEADDAESQRILAGLEANPVLKARYDRLRAQRTLLAMAWRDEGEDAVMH